MIQPLVLSNDLGADVRSEIEQKINELIDAYNNHVHYARELQLPTSTPDNPKVYG